MILSCFENILCFTKVKFVQRKFADIKVGIRILKLDFPGGTVVKNLPANAGDTGSIPGLGRSHMPWSN